MLFFVRIQYAQINLTCKHKNKYLIAHKNKYLIGIL